MTCGDYDACAPVVLSTTIDEHGKVRARRRRRPAKVGQCPSSSTALTGQADPQVARPS